MSATKLFLENNKRYAKSFIMKGLPMPPSKKTAVVACMDARIETGRLLGLKEGDAHVIRNAGGVITEDVVRSLAISQWLQNTEEIILIHHRDCGLLTMSDEQFNDRIEAETGRRPTFGFHAISNLDESVRRSMEQLRTSPFLPKTDRIRGFIFDEQTGRLEEVR